MSAAPSFEDVFAVMSAASVGDRTARVAIPDAPQLDDATTKFALALNILLDDLALAAADAQRQLAERGRLADRLQVLTDASREFSLATGDLEQLLGIVARRLGELVGDFCAIRPMSEDGAWIEAAGAAYHRDPELLAATRAVMLSGRQRVGDGLSGRVVASRQPLLVPKTDGVAFAASSAPRYRGYLECLSVTSAIVLPLICRGEVVGVANLMRSGSARAYDEEDLQFVQSVADHAALAIANARSRAATRMSEQRYRLMFENTPLPKWMYDVETLRILDANRAATRDYGYSHEELLTMSITDLEVEHGVRKKSGEIRQVEITTHTFTLGDRACRLSVGIDVTERVRLEEQLRQSQKMEAVGVLAGGVAHDFNNVLSVILSYSEMMLAGMKQDDPLRGDVQEIQTAGNRAADLTRQLLMFSRQQVVAPKVLDLNEVLRRLDKMLQRILGADVSLVSLPAASLGRVRIDPTGIEQVIMNLVVNARDAMPTGGQLTMETGNVVLDEAYARSHVGVVPGPHVMLAVTDTGTGIDKATADRIFEPFFTTKAQGKGTGLGLSTVFGIVRQSGGSVWVYSEPGHGTTFKVYLPCVAQSTDVAQTPAPRPSSRGCETILLVEDDEQVRCVAQAILTDNGYRVLVALSTAGAIDFAEHHPGAIDMLLTDVIMPGMSGPKLATKLHAVRPDMKVLYMSGYTDDAVVRHGVLEAKFDYLQKPFTPNALASRVRAVLSSARPIEARELEPLPSS